jgi:hypothetical protein
VTVARALRWTLHPRTPALLLVAVVLAGAAAALRGTAGAGALLACAAGCAAGFANSGST